MNRILKIGMRKPSHYGIKGLKHEPVSAFYFEMQINRKLCIPERKNDLKS